MKLILPHKSYDLDLSLDIEEKMTITKKILSDKIVFGQKEISVEDYFSETWHEESTKTALDIMSYYLTKEDKNLEIISNYKRREMENGSKRHTTFTSMGVEDKISLGVMDVDDYYYE